MRIRNAGRSWRYQAEIASLGSAKPLLTFTPAAHISLFVFAYQLGNASNVSSSQIETAFSKATGGSAGGSPVTVTPIALDGAAGAPSGLVQTAVTGLTYDGTTDEDLQAWPSGAGYIFRPPAADDWLYLPAGASNIFSLRSVNAPGVPFNCLVVVDLIEAIG